MIDNFSKLFEDSVNKQYINQLNQGELEKIISILDQSHDEDDKENNKEDNSKTSINTQRAGVTTHRVGQDLFRRKLLIKFNNKCAVTGIENEEMLLASHILPWKDANDFQRLDIENGILLDPYYDKLFDKFFISFSDSGKIILSEKLKNSEKLLEFVNADAVIPVSEGMKKYLKIHRKNLKN